MLAPWSHMRSHRSRCPTMCPITDTERLPGYPDAEAEDFDDLADGSILAVPRLFLSSRGDQVN